MIKFETNKISIEENTILAIITIILIFVALKITYKKSKEQIYKIIKISTITIWILEIIKIIYNIKVNTIYEVNRYIPLYYCSIILYAGILSTYGKENFKRAGDVTIAIGGLVGGIGYIVYLLNNSLEYPIYHFLTIHSFIFHGILLYLGILVNITDYIDLKITDVIYYSYIIGIMCVFSLIINGIFDTNFMFLSKNYPGTPIEGIYKSTNGGVLYNLVMITGEMALPYFITFFSIKIIKEIKKKIIEGR